MTRTRVCSASAVMDLELFPKVLVMCFLEPHEDNKHWDSELRVWFEIEEKGGK